MQGSNAETEAIQKDIDMRTWERRCKHFDSDSRKRRDGCQWQGRRAGEWDRELEVEGQKTEMTSDEGKFGRRLA